MKFDNPLISLIVPVYNAEKYLARCITSIKQQTLSNFECIIVNDGSTDNSLKIIHNMCNNDLRFKIYDIDNHGVSFTRNFALDKIHGKWITFCDSDDWLQPDRFEVAYLAATKSNVQIIWNGINIYKNNKLIDKWHNNISGLYCSNDSIILSTKQYDIGHTPNKLYNASLIQDNNIRFPNISMAEDLIFNIEAYFISGKIFNISNCLYNYEKHENSLSTNRSKNKFIELYTEFLKLQKKFKNNIEFNKNINIIDSFIKNIFNYT